MNDLYCKEEGCIGLPRFYKLYRKVFDKPNNADPCVAWALMRIYQPRPNDNFYMEADLMFIYTHEPGSGYGLELLKNLQGIFPVIRTSISGSTKDGRALCEKSGFVRDTKQDDILIWRLNEKEEKDVGEKIG